MCSYLLCFSTLTRQRNHSKKCIFEPWTSWKIWSSISHASREERATDTSDRATFRHIPNYEALWRQESSDNTQWRRTEDVRNNCYYNLTFPFKVREIDICEDLLVLYCVTGLGKYRDGSLSISSNLSRALCTGCIYKG